MNIRTDDHDTRINENNHFIDGDNSVGFVCNGNAPAVVIRFFLWLRRIINT